MHSAAVNGVKLLRGKALDEHKFPLLREKKLGARGSRTYDPAYCGTSGVKMARTENKLRVGTRQILQKFKALMVLGWNTHI